MHRGSTLGRRWSSLPAADPLTPRSRRPWPGVARVLGFALGVALAGSIAGSESAESPERDLHEVVLSPGRNEARVRFRPGPPGKPGERIFQGGDRDRFARVEPGQTYLLPESLWDRFTGNRSGPFRIEVRTRRDESVLASGRLVGRSPAGDGTADTLWVFEGEPSDRGLGLFVVTRPRGDDGNFPAPPKWADDFLAPILAALSREFGPFPGSTPPVVVVLNFPSPTAKAFPGALLVDERLARGDEAPPAGRLAVLAHEAGHLWWGNAVEASPSAGGATLMEGLAEYGACRAVGQVAGPEAEDARWAALRDESLLASEAAAAAGATVLNGYESFGRGLRYARAAWLIRMLRARVGAAAFGTALARLQAPPRIAGWDDLLAAAGASSGVDLVAFKRHWLESARHPDPILTMDASTPGSLRIVNRGLGAGEFPVSAECEGGAPTVEFLALAPGAEGRSAGMTKGCKARLDPEGVFLLGPPGPPPAAGLVLGRGWGFPVVRSVRPDSPAERAGLRDGDLIVELAGRPLAEKDAAWLQRELAGGRALRLRVRRGLESHEVAWPGTNP